MISDGSKNPYSLLNANWSVYKWQILVQMLPRLAITGFTYSQTFLIHTAVNYLETPKPLRNTNNAYGLIGATVLIYLGIALSSSTWNRLLYRITTAVRASTVALVYDKALRRQAGYNELAAVTVMSTDIDRMTTSFTRVSDLWAQMIEVILGVYLLWRQLGAIAIAPIIVSLLCFGAQSYWSRFMGPRQMIWVKAIQRRVGICSSVLRSMKSVKLTGLVESMSELVQSERVRELKMAKQFRLLSVWVNVVANMAATLSPLVAFAAYVIKADLQHTPQLTTAQAFTALSILTLMMSPVSQLLSAMPIMAAGMGCLRRIHAFISSDVFDDTRKHPDQSGRLDSDSNDIIAFDNVVLACSENAEKDVITFEATRGSLTTIVGPVGCGKSTLLRSILGEIKPASGTIFVATMYIGYCSQTPWLPNKRIRDAIVGPNEFDKAWYQQILKVCELESDFAQMQENDWTLVGSRGIVLSGGQKHRIVSVNFSMNGYLGS
jgi:ATP-binding cassette subfamily C (CFTR/MRP) protein 1